MNYIHADVHAYICTMYIYTHILYIGLHACVYAVIGCYIWLKSRD